MPVLHVSAAYFGPNKSQVTVVTGFLGAGKTTLVNYILKEQASWGFSRVVVGVVAPWTINNCTLL